MASLGSWQLTPDGLIYRSYLAGMREPRLAGVWEYDRKLGWMLDAAVGGRVGPRPLRNRRLAPARRLATRLRGRPSFRVWRPSARGISWRPISATACR